MSSKTKLNYAVDLVIGIAFIFSALSGLVLFFAPSGYQGGRNPSYLEPVLLLSRQAWDIIHTWSSIAMISGVGAHLVLHWEWMVCVTKRLLRSPKPRVSECPVEA
jgi:cytochrome b subunit of formate dehydrogenase